MQVLFLIGRIILGGYFIYSGIAHFIGYKGLRDYAAFKKIPLAGAAVIVTGVMLLVGGLGIVLWYAVPIAALILAVFLLGSAIFMHNFWKEKDPMARMNHQVNFFKNISLVGALFLVAVFYMAFFVVA